MAFCLLERTTGLSAKKDASFELRGVEDTSRRRGA
jgi:hypothetical protein